MLKIARAFLKFLFNNLYLNKYDRAYIEYNKKKWNSYISRFISMESIYSFLELYNKYYFKKIKR